MSKRAEGLDVVLMGLFKNVAKKRFTLIFILFLIPFLSYLSFINYAESPVGEGKRTVTVDIPKGTGFRGIVDILEQKGLVQHRLSFYLLAFSQRAAGHIKAGEYEFTVSMTPLDILKKLRRGDIKGYLVTFPEDITLREVAARLAAYRLVDEQTFLKLSTDREFLDSLGVEGPSLEGFLYPETYLLDRSMETREVIRIMVRQFWKRVTPQLLSKARESGFTTQELITLASIIGKESGDKGEKTLISAVFHNRLKKGMKLQSDPTAVYEVNGFSGIIKKKDLLNNNPHNTYLIKGLPPTAIANPGIDSIKAALSPAKVDFLYFVSKNDGTHSFSTNYATHNEAISRYRNQGEQDPVPDLGGAKTVTP